MRKKLFFYLFACFPLLISCSSDDSSEDIDFGGMKLNEIQQIMEGTWYLVEMTVYEEDGTQKRYKYGPKSVTQEYIIFEDDMYLKWMTTASETCIIVKPFWEKPEWGFGKPNFVPEGYYYFSTEYSGPLDVPMGIQNNRLIIRKGPGFTPQTVIREYIRAQKPELPNWLDR